MSSIIRHEEELTASLARDVGLLEQQVMGGVEEDPETFLEQLFKVRHKLLTVRTMAAQTREVYGRLVRVAGFVPDAGVPLFDDLVDQYGRLRGIADGQLAFLHGVTEYYRARTDTKMTIAAERLALPVGTRFAEYVGGRATVLIAIHPDHLPRQFGVGTGPAGELVSTEEPIKL